MQTGRGERLNRAEDHELRRLHLFRKFGVVAGRMSARYDELRDRDRRAAVRPPVEEAVISRKS